GADRRHPGPVPRAPGSGDGLVPRPRHQRGLDGPARHLARPARPRAAPARVWAGRIAGGRRGRWIAGVGIAAATVQVVGLQRWVTLVPGISNDALDPGRRTAAEDRFELWHTLLGK